MTKNPLAEKLKNHKLILASGSPRSYYIETFEPYDKAGAYGIQEWIGLIGIEEIKGLYTNVVGLPTQLVYKTLSNF